MPGVLQRFLLLAGGLVNVPIYHASFPPRRLPGQPLRQVGIFKADGLGDFILAAGAIRTVLDQHGHENCVLITSPAARDYARHEFPAAALAVVKPFSGRLWRTRHVLRELAQTPLFRQGVEELVSFRHQRYLHQDLILASIPCRRSYGLQNPPNRFEREWARTRLRFDVEREWPGTVRPGWCRELECHQALLELMLGSPVDPESTMPRLTAMPNGTREPWVAVAPYGTHALRDLPLPMLAALGRHLSERHQLPLRLLSSPAQLERLTGDAATLRALGVPSVDVLLTPNVPALIAAVGRTRLLVSTETGTSHLGTAADVPMLGIIGGGHYGLFGPWRRSGRQRWVSRQLPCYGCNWKCVHPRALCITDIPDVEILRAADEILEITRQSALSP